jgi:DNA-binding SARP family transcriptional activator
MENHKENIDKLVIKLKVLESRIQKLELLTDEVLLDVESEYQQRLIELHQKREEAWQKLLTIRNTDNLE